MDHKKTITHGAVYFGLKAVEPLMESLFHNNGQIFQELQSLHMNCSERWL